MKIRRQITLRRIRMLMVAILIGIVLAILTITNEHISYIQNFRKAQPFLLSSFAFALVIAVLWVRAPTTVPWYKFWQWIDPLIIVITGLILAAMIYDGSLWLGQSERYAVPSWVYDDARFLKWVSGYASIIVLVEMLIDGLRSRRSNSRRDQSIYDDRQQATEGA